MTRDGATSSTPEPPRAWQRMLSGRRLDLINPDPADIEIADIAHGLSRLARWNGQTLGSHAFTVAQHVLLVEEICADLRQGLAPEWRLAALLHDAPEYVIGDLISPFKTAIGLDYKSFEIKLLAAIHARFGLQFPLPDDVAALIKSADRIAAFYEATVLAGFSREEAARFFGRPDGISERLARSLMGIVSLPPDEAQRSFLASFAALTETV